MISIHQLLEGLAPHIVERHVHFLPKKSFIQIHILDGQPISNSRLLYIGTPDTFVQTVDQLSEGGIFPTFVLSGNSPALSAYEGQPRFNLIVTSLSLATLCNLLYQVSSSYNLWVQSMNRHLYVKPDLPALLECGSRKLQCYTCLLDAGQKLLCSSPGPVPPHPIFERLEEGSYLSYESFQELERLRAASENKAWFSITASDGEWKICCHPIQYRSQTVAHHLIVIPAQRSTISTKEMAARFQGWTEQFVLRYNHEKYETSNALSDLMADLIEGRLTESEQLVDRIKQLPVHMKKYYHCIIVDLSSYCDASLTGRLLQELEQVFPNGLITTYKGDVLILAWKARHYTEPLFDKSAFQEVLKNYDAYACIGNFTRWLSSLRYMYNQAKGTIKYAKVFCSDPEERIFRFEDYSMYQIVGLCVDHCKDFHDGDPVYLCHPGVITLVTYDLRHKTNLYQVLYTYLRNDRNLTQTARDLFFHRNTLQHKIEKIESIVNESLDSSAIRQRLLFSCMVVEYMQKYMKREDIFGRKRNTPATAALVEE